MSTAVQQVVTEARALAHDGYGNHFIIDTLTAQATGAATVFKLNNQNVVQATDGAPSNVVATVNGSTVSVSSVNEQSGQVTLSAAPAAGSLVQIAYYFVLNTDTEFITFCQNAERFTLGVTPTINALTSLVDVPDNLVGAMVHYTAQLAARSMASLAHWYYNGSAGGKTFDKASIAEGWARQAEDLKKEAEGLREDVYTRFDQIKAPAWGNRGLSGLRPWTPPR